MDRMRYLCLSALLLSSAIPVRAQTAPPSPANRDEGFVIEQLRTTQRFETDGTGRREMFMRIKVQSDAGVQQWGQLVVGYTAATENLDFPFVRVHKSDGSTVETGASAIQDLTAPVQRIAPVYTDFRQKHVTVPSLRPGDTLEFSVVTTIHTAIAAGEFWTDHSFNDESIVLDEQLDVDLPAGRRVLLKVAPGFDPTTKEADGRKVYHWSHSHPVRENPKDAPPKKHDGDEAPAPIRLTSFPSWEAVGTWFGRLEASARTPTPDVRQKARELTAGKTTEMEKLEALYDFVSKNFRYVSLSLGAGRYQPRTAGSVLRDAYGDCKDKHTLLASLIDASGLRASAVLMSSTTSVDPDFPSPSQFDHVITRATAGGKTVWLDTTPGVAPFGLIVFPLRDKQGLVVERTASSHLERTPVDSDVRALVATTVDAAIAGDGTFAGDVTLSFRGDLEVAVRTTFRATSEAQWKNIVDAIAGQSVEDGTVTNLKISDPESTKAPFSIAFHVEAPGYMRWGSKDVNLALPFAGSAVVADPSDSGKVRLGATGEFTYALTLRLPDGASAQPPIPVALSRDYAGYRSAYSVRDRTFSVERRLSLKMPVLDEGRRDDYAAFLRVVRTDGAQHVSVDGARVAAVTTPASTAAEAKSLAQRGAEAVRAGDFYRAVPLLKRAVEIDPKARSAWGDLGDAYASLRRLPEAIEAFNKQIDVNPYDQYAYNSLGLVYVRQRRYPEAEAAYLKQLEINPLDRFATSNLGRMYIEQHQYEKAAAALERAVTVAPTVASYQVQLGKAYLFLQQRDKALAAFDKAANVEPKPGTWNDIAYELSLFKIDLERAQRFAESAVSAVSASSRNVSVDRADKEALATVRSLGSYWDTLGWVLFAKGDLPAAERYLTAAWNLAHAAEVGDHLGQLLEKQGRRDDAATAYARALASDRSNPMVRDHLVALVGAAQTDMLVQRHRDDLKASRTIAFSRGGPAGKHADFYAVFAPSGVPDSVRFINGDDDLRSFAADIQALHVDGMFPNDQPARLLRRLTLSCDADGRCTATLIAPALAQPAR